MSLHKGIYKFDIFEDHQLLYHSITTKQLPSVRNVAEKEIDLGLVDKVLTKLHIPQNNVVMMNQMHTVNIAEIKDAKDRFIKNTDGLLLTRGKLFGGIATADCLPVIILDPEMEMLALLHAGYKGLSDGILQKAVEKMIAYGSNPECLLAGIGPGIGVCCYNVPYERTKLFSAYKKHAVRREGKFYLDLKRIASLQLQNSGIIKENIETAPYCTVCNNDLFFSYRAEGENFGEFLTVGGLIK